MRSSAISIPLDFATLVGFGKVPGYTRVTAIGHNPDVDVASVPEDVWEPGGVVPWISVATILEVLSSDANDTSAGTGARTVLISGLDANYIPQSETLTLNGVTPVQTTKSYLRINNFMINGAGSSEVNVGDLTLRITGGGSTQSMIRSLVGFARSSIYTVPVGFTLSMHSLVLSVNKSGGIIQNATMNTYFRSPTGFYRTPLILDATSSGPYLHEGLPGIILPEKTDIAIRCTYTSANNMDITAGWLGILKDNNY